MLVKITMTRELDLDADDWTDAEVVDHVDTMLHEDGHEGWNVDVKWKNLTKDEAIARLNLRIAELKRDLIKKGIDPDALIAGFINET